MQNAVTQNKHKENNSPQQIDVERFQVVQYDIIWIS